MQEDEDLAASVTRAWRNETLAPELLPFAAVPVANAKETIDRQVRLGSLNLQDYPAINSSQSLSSLLSGRTHR